MTLFKKPVSVKGALLTLLLPAGIALMTIAWFVHGLLLERMSREFVESRLKDEVAFLELNIRQAEGKIDMLKTGDYFEKVFHHAFAIQSSDQTVISPQSWQPLLNPLLQFDGDESIRVHNELHAWTAIVSILLMFLLVGVIWFGINLSMRPVVSLQAALKRLQSGEISRIDAEAPEEFRPLVLQLNQLLDSLDQRLERSREALANLSHSVKTPIAAVRQVLDDTSRPLDESLRHEMGSRLGDIDRQLEAEMRRSRFAGPQIGKSAFPVKQARDLLWMLGRLYPEKSFELSTSLTEEFRWPIEEHDLNEILGNLLDNAGKWSAECVELFLEQHDGLALIVVTDDGSGVSEGDLVNLGQRGRRLDEQTPGHGLGLAIVREIVARYEGETSFSNGLKGGLKVLIKISI
jgi:signal transduction histidine kinase